MARLVAGWGVLGGLRLLHADSPHFGLFGSTQGVSAATLATLTPNPQVVAGPIVQVTAGAAIDGAGNTLVLERSCTIDIRELSRGLQVPEESRECEGWLGSFCSGLPGPLRAAQYWVVARSMDPAHPADDPSLSRNGSATKLGARNEQTIHISLVPELPALYFLHGNLSSLHIPFMGELLSMLMGTVETVSEMRTALHGSVTPEILHALTEPRRSQSAASSATDAFGGVGFKLVPQLLDFINSIPINAHCDQPGVVLGRVLLASRVPNGVRNALGDAACYTVIDDAFPYRRLVPNAAANHMLLTALAALLVTATEGVA